MCDGRGVETIPSEDGPIKYACKGCSRCQTKGQKNEAVRVQDLQLIYRDDARGTM